MILVLSSQLASMVTVASASKQLLMGQNRLPKFTADGLAMSKRPEMGQEEGKWRAPKGSNADKEKEMVETHLCASERYVAASLYKFV